MTGRRRPCRDATASSASRSSASGRATWLAGEHAARWPTGTPTHAQTAERRRAPGAAARSCSGMLCDGGFAGICCPDGVRRPRPHPRAPARVQRGVAAYDMPVLAQRADASASSAPTLARRSAPRSRSASTSPPSLRASELLGAVPLRAQRRLRPRRRRHPRRPRRRRVGHQRLEDLELAAPTSADYAHVPGPHQLGRAQAPRPDDVHHGVHQPGVARRTASSRSTASIEFCQEFFDDVVVPAAAVVGDVDDGWTVASRLLFHERNAVGGGSPYVSGARAEGRRGTETDALIDLVRAHRPGRTTPTRASWSPRRTPSASSTGTSSTGSPRACARRRCLPPAGSLISSSRRERHPPGRDRPRARRPGRRDVRPRRARHPRAWASHFLFRQATRSAAAATRCSATSSANGSSACPASTPPTATSPSTRSGTGAEGRTHLRSSGRT